MSILNVNKINPVGGGSTITIAGIASVTNNISVGNSVTAGSFVGPIEGNVTGNVTGNSDTASGLSGNPSINTTGIITATTLNYTGNQNLSNRNLVINGAMQVAQRGTSSTSSGYFTVDRFTIINTGTDESPTQAQVDVSSGTSPYTSGFRKALKVTNGNQTGGAAGDFIWIQTIIEAQDIATSGWNYTSSSSYVTLSFWVKSSVAQDFKGYLRSRDGTNYEYPFATGALTADTWTKITKTIPGNSNIQIDNDNGPGLEINLFPFLGTNRTDNNATENAWATFNSAARTKDNTSTWYTTNDATLEITGYQLEVGPVVTPFEHRSFGDELARCQRYFFNITGDSNVRTGVLGYANDSNAFRGVVSFPSPMRGTPTFTGSTTAMVVDSADDSSSFNVNTISMSGVPGSSAQNTIFQAVVEASPGGMTAGQCGQLEFRASNGFMNFDAELQIKLCQHLEPT